MICVFLFTVIFFAATLSKNPSVTKLTVLRAIVSNGWSGIKSSCLSLHCVVTTHCTCEIMELRMGLPTPCRNFSKPLSVMYLNKPSPMRVSNKYL